MLFNHYTSALLCLGGAAVLPATVLCSPAASYTRAAPPITTSSPSTNSSAGIPAPSKFIHLAETYVSNTRSQLKSGSCTKENIGLRKSWEHLKNHEREDYLRAVNCLAAKPARTDKSLAPGVRNRLDDFTYIHINQTNIIHNDGYLLPWHRMFLWQMEQALRNECGYKGYLPYWDMGSFSQDQTKSAVWDGSETSFGGNGKCIPHETFNAPIPGLVQNVSIPKPAGTGGGCLTNGPFKNLSLSLGPVSVLNPKPDDIYGYKPNPRCLSRDFFQPSSSANLTWDHFTTLVTSPTIATFRVYLEQHIHANSHLFIGAEAADPFSTPNDPAFYLLHAQIDRMWAIWQGQDFESRTFAIDGFRTFFGIPLAVAPNVKPSNATIHDTMDMGLGFKPKVNEAMSATQAGMCFMYA